MTCAKCRHSCDTGEGLLCRRNPPIYLADNHSVFPNVEESWICGEFKTPTKKSVAQFVPPTVEEVTEYCTERNNGIDPWLFVDWNTARGWKLRTGPIKDWKAVVRTWEARQRDKTVEDITAERVPLAASHKRFAKERPMSQQDKARAAAELANLAKKIQERAK